MRYMSWIFWLLFVQVERVDMEMPNVHYFLADLAKIGMQNNNQVRLGKKDKSLGPF